MRTELEEAGGTVSSALVAVELHRAALRRGRETVERVGGILAGLSLVPLDADILYRASRLGPAELRALDAIHVATALSIGDVDPVVTYDIRMARAAEEAGLRARAPA